MQNAAFGAHVKGIGLVAPVPQVITPDNSDLHGKDSCSASLDSYLQFIRKGFVPMVGSGVKAPVIILRDTGAFDSGWSSTVIQRM